MYLLEYMNKSELLALHKSDIYFSILNECSNLHLTTKYIPKHLKTFKK